MLASAAERTVLACDPTTPAFAIERIGRAGARAVEWRQTLVRAARP